MRDPRVEPIPDKLIRDLGREYPLSMRERLTLMYFSHGLERRMVAEAMGISPETVADHTDRARLKLAAKTTCHAVALAIRQGLIP